MEFIKHFCLGGGLCLLGWFSIVAGYRTYRDPMGVEPPFRLAIPEEDRRRLTVGFIHGVFAAILFGVVASLLGVGFLARALLHDLPRLFR